MKFLLVLVTVVGLTWYYHKPLPPGQGPNADAGKRAATPLLRTLEAYRGAHGRYPESLEDLIPDHLSKLPLLSNGSAFEYQPILGNYELTFNYTNPLPVHCSYQTATKWVCDWF